MSIDVVETLQDLVRIPSVNQVLQGLDYVNAHGFLAKWRGYFSG